MNKKSKFIELPNLGKFIKKNNDIITFIPCVEFLQMGNFEFPQNDYNVSPYSDKIPTKNTC